MVLAVDSIRGQSLSPIGSYLAPWGGGGSPSYPVMTPDGPWIAFVETLGYPCSLSQQRISMIRTDGTGYRVVVDADTLETLDDESVETLIDLLVISGDAAKLVFSWPHEVDWTCTQLPPRHNFLVDVDSGVAKEIFHEGTPVGSLSFTDDGSRLCFKGYDPDTGNWWIHVAEPDGTKAVKVLETSPWFSTRSVISGDGSKILLIGVTEPFPYPSNVYLYDIASSVLTQVNPTPLDDIRVASTSRDGSRVVYSKGNGPLYAIMADGTDFHVITNVNSGGSGTISRNGEYVFYRISPGVRRTDWSGADLIEIDAWNVSGVFMRHQPVSADGSVMACEAPELGSNSPLAVWFAEPPVLTSYGHGIAGTTLTLDVGGQPGDAFVLGFEPLPSGPLSHYVAAQGLGPMGLADLFAPILVPGVVTGPTNTGTMQLILPPQLELYAPVSVVFQALVVGNGGTDPETTNRTVMTLQSTAGASLATSGSAGPPTNGGTYPRGRQLHESGEGRELEPLERLRQMALDDPAVVWNLKRMGWEHLLEDHPPARPDPSR